MTVQARSVFVTGGTGYMGSRLIVRLMERGHRVRALARRGSEARVPVGAQVVTGDALDATTFVGALSPDDTLVHLVGTPHPSPSKATEFQRVDLPSIRASVAAAQEASIAHLVYVSVGHPAPMMKDYIAVRAAGEAMIAAAGLTATALRPWYVLGPGHWWPLLLVPAYAIAELLPPTREGARRLGLVTLPQMIRALVQAVEAPPPRATLRIVDVPAIRRARLVQALSGP
jgi:uncharacterized protein YbjT (DUF2867 family)